MSQNSCIVSQFQSLVDLDANEMSLLESLERDAQSYPAETTLVEMGAECGEFYTLKSGWACSVRLLSDGQRQVLDIFLPGQIMGLREINFERSQTELITVTDVVACPFPRNRLRQGFRESPRLADLFFVVMAREQAILTERIINIGRRPAIDRLAHFILEMRARLNPTSDRMELPLNQNLIGDALGLSSVHVSRTLSGLREKGLIDTDNGEIRLLDPAGLVELSGFNDAYLRIALD
jgi:CRP-like cAMP-binding protein